MSGRAPGYGAALLVAALFFAAIAPTLDWLEFSGGSENLVVGAVVEIERGGPYLVPTLEGEPRIKKPPLPTWIADAGVRDATARQLSSPDQATRDAAFRALSFQIRWTSLLSACLMLVATYALGRTIADGRVGLVAALVCGSTIMFLRFGRAATTDVQLALWVTLANAFLAAAVFRGRVWTGAIGAGVTLGLAFMSKGPVALLQSIVPFLIFVAWRGWDGKRHGRDRRIAADSTGGAVERGTFAQGVFTHGGFEDSTDSREAKKPKRLVPVLLGLLAFLFIALPWPVAVIATRPGVLHEWYEEISRKGATDLPPDPWYVYTVLFLYLAPWVAWFIAAIAVSVTRMRGRLRGSSQPDSYGQGLVLSLLLTFVPVLVMSLVKDKNERYLFPMVAPAGVMVALAIVGWITSGRPRDAGARVVRFAHWATLLALAVGVPVLCATLRTVEGNPWLSRSTAGVWAGLGSLIALAGLFLDRTRAYAMVVAGVVLMLLVQYPFLAGYRDYPQGRAELKPLADAIWSTAPDAEVFELDIEGRTRVRYDLPIYLNRITHKTATPLELRQGERPKALVYFESRKAPEPVLPPPWTRVAEKLDGKDKWKLYVLPADALRN